ncbi:pleckstrin domain-containing protein [Heterostelium album PN500]|uniref:Pleckstrin domain-containing protein n=1 Tax=Heterostelium pallidum (strain ATCC 26659 / Pp 5 / PN500) TaxID=670386 RepID=D3BLW3_HETP5|nr:pleckstrin domain-containing protein [Heterostelium album PN500]EFA77564.1 pleckstrin domain-containing protein [Heterostelium album PN500]|eukprot:XP_020429692.1 pleckstrin domain-containing protein [Heterostelium album PN500]
MTSKSYVSGSHANWENIQLDSFTGWINQHLQERSLVVKDLATDFSDGVMLINLLEVISGKKVSRYVRNPKFLQHKIDNIMVALLFMEKVLDIKVVGCNAKDIVDGNLKQIMGVSFLLIQKVKSSMQLEIDPTLLSAMSSNSLGGKRATIIGTPVSRFAHKSLNQDNSNSNNIHSGASDSETSSSGSSSGIRPVDSRATTTPSTIEITSGVGVSTLRNRFASAPTTRPTDLGSLSTSLPASGTAAASSHSVLSSSDTKLERGMIRKTKSGAIMCGTFDFGGKQHSLRKLVVVQAHVRGWIARRRVRVAMEKHRQRMRSYEEHFASNPKAYRGLTKVQARTKAKIERRRLWRQYPLFRRNDIVKEILATERKYVKCLEILIECYLRECEKILQPNQVKSIFSQIEVIKNVNYNLLTQMENRFKEGSKQQLGEIFKRTTDYLKVYTNYVNNYNASIAAINECKENEKFAKLLEQNRIAEKCMGLDLSAFLIMPIQRLPRYVLLLQDLVKFTSDDHPDYDNLSVALKKMKDVAEYVNEKKREAENLNQVLNIQHSLVGKFDNLAEPHRRYVRKGPLACLEEKSKIYFFFLFNDILLKTENKNLAKQLSQSKNSRNTLTGVDEGKFKFIVSYHLDGASLIDLADPNNPFSFQLIGITTNTGMGNELGASIGTTAITLTASSLGEKMIWINDIDECISQLLEKTRSKKRSLITDYDELTTATYEAPIKDAEMSGILIKQHTEILWKQKQFYLKNGNLFYNTIFEDTNEKLVQVVDHPHCFQLITPLRIYFFSCPDGQTLFLWISLIRSSIAKKLDSLTESDEVMSLKQYSQTQQLYHSQSLNNYNCNRPEKKRHSLPMKLSSFPLFSSLLSNVSSKHSSSNTSNASTVNNTPLIHSVSTPTPSAYNNPHRNHHHHHNPSVYFTITSASLPSDLSSTGLSQSYNNNCSSLSSSCNSLSSSSSGSCYNSLSSSVGSMTNNNSTLNSSISSITNYNINSNDFLSEPANQSCADCGASDPSWISTSFGVVLCVECSGVHRHLPNGASHVKSLRGLSSSNLDVDHLKNLDGNARANQKYEKNVPSHINRPSPKDSVDIRLPWIYAKYLPGTPIPSSPSEVRRASVKMTGGSSPPSPLTQLSGSLVGSVGKLDHFIELKNQSATSTSTMKTIPEEQSTTTSTSPTSTSNANVTTTSNQTNTNKNEQHDGVKNINGETNNSNVSNAELLSDPTSSESLGLSCNNSASTSVISTPNSLNSADVDGLNGNEFNHPSSSPVLLANNNANANNDSMSTSDSHSSTPGESSSTTNNTNGNDNNNNSNESSPTMMASSSSANSTASSMSPWKGHSQLPAIERKKSVFLDKPRKEIRKEIDGVLYKTSSPSKSSNWKKYHFFFKDGLLNYFKLDDKKMKKPRGSIDLKDFYSLKVEPKPKQQHSFTLITKYRLYFFACDTHEDLKSWVEVLSVDSKGVSYQ